MPLDELLRELPGRRRRAGAGRRRLRERERLGRTPELLEARARRSTSTTTTTTPASAPSTSSSPTRRRRARSCATCSRELGVELTPGDRRGALRRRSSPTPAASSTRTRRRRRCGSRPSSSRRAPTSTAIFQRVYETVQFAKLKLLARALERAAASTRAAGSSSRTSLRDDFAEVGAEEPYSEGIIDYLRAVEGADIGGADPRAAARRGPTRRIRLRSNHDELDVSAIARASGRRRPPAGGGLLERATRSTRSSSSSAASSPPRRRGDGAAARARAGGLVLVDKPAGPSSFAIVAELRRRTGARTGPRRHARPVRDRAAASCCPARQRGWRHASSASTSAT